MYLFCFNESMSILVRAPAWIHTKSLGITISDSIKSIIIALTRWFSVHDVTRKQSSTDNNNRKRHFIALSYLDTYKENSPMYVSKLSNSNSTIYSPEVSMLLISITTFMFEASKRFCTCPPLEVLYTITVTHPETP